MKCRKARTGTYPTLARALAQRDALKRKSRGKVALEPDFCGRCLAWHLR